MHKSASRSRRLLICVISVMYIGYIYRLYCIGSVAYSSGGFTFVVEHIGIGCKDKHDHRQYYRIAASLCFPSLPTSYLYRESARCSRLKGKSKVNSDFLEKTLFEKKK